MQSELNELNIEIESLSRILSHTPDDHPNVRLLLACLGEAHHTRYNLLGKEDDIHNMIEYTTTALALTSDDDPNLLDILRTLGIAYGQRFSRLGETDDIEKGVEYMSLAIALIPEYHPDLPQQLANLGMSYCDRFEHLGNLDDIEKALEHISRAVALTPKEHPALAENLGIRSRAHLTRFRRLGDLDDLEKAIEHQSCGIALAPNNHPRLPNMLSRLASALSNRFHRLGQLDDLEKAIEYQSRAIALTPHGHPDSSSFLSNLGRFHRNRFKGLGELNDLEKAVDYGFRALALISDAPPHLAIILAHLGVSHSDRFQLLGELNDIEKAIEYQSRALALTPDGHLELSRRLGDLGVAHKLRFERLGKLDDLDKAIKYESGALASISHGHPDLSIRLAHIGASHSYRFGCSGELNDIEKAIEYQARALSSTPDDHPDMARWLSNLGAYHDCRYQLLGELKDLDKAIECQSCALEVGADDHPDICLKHFNLALAHARYYEYTNQHSHLHDSLQSFRIACKSPVGAPRDKFRYAHRWASWASDNNALSCIEAYETTIGLLPQFIWLGATTSQRYEDLKMTAALAGDAACAAILSSSFSLALEWLEHARCIVWNQNLMLRSPLDQLHTSHPALAARLETVANQLHSAGSESRESRILTSGSMTEEQVAQEHRRLAKEYEELLTQARMLPGFIYFLESTKVAELLNAAHHGPVVVINCHEDRCDALIILPKESNVAYLPLPNFTATKARDTRSMIEASLNCQGLRERGVRIRKEPGHEDGFGRALAMIWNELVKPTLDFLGFMNGPPMGNLPHITWCPTGAASFLPLHAAGDYDQPHSRIFNYVISSYTPTLTALLASTPSTLSSHSRLLVIGQPATPGHKPLPGTAREVEHVKSHVKDKVGYLELIGDQATPSAVLDAMEQHDWVHLACHAHQNVYDPTKSGLFLHKGTLDLAAINRRSFKKKGLAFLSACQTATGDETLPDEAVHLASGMLMAGYSSVIATMWSVVDEDAPFLADKVYNQLMVDGKLGNGEAGKALHHAVAGLRTKVGEQEFGRWVPYIHIGS